jgi:Sec-independent protein translocase protein TatA
VGLGTEILFILAFGLLILGPRRLHTLIEHVALAKAQFEEASRGLKSQFKAELDAMHQKIETDASHELAGVEEADDQDPSEVHTREIV